MGQNFRINVTGQISEKAKSRLLSAVNSIESFVGKEFDHVEIHSYSGRDEHIQFYDSKNKKWLHLKLLVDSGIEAEVNKIWIE